MTGIRLYLVGIIGMIVYKTIDLTDRTIMRMMKAFVRLTFKLDPTEDKSFANEFNALNSTSFIDPARQWGEEELIDAMNYMYGQLEDLTMKEAIERILEEIDLVEGMKDATEIRNFNVFMLNMYKDGLLKQLNNINRYDEMERVCKEKLEEELQNEND